MYTQAVAERDLADRTASEYKDSILQHMIEQDVLTRPDPQMISMQPEIEWRMWPYMVDFMVQVHQKLRLEPQTLFLATNIVNRYCSRRIVFRKHFQLVGTTALWIAAKYEDKKSRVPPLRCLSHMCSGVYEDLLFVQMEGHMLNTLEWSICHCTVDTFLGVLNSSSQPGMPSPLLVSLTSYIAEITLFHKDFVGQNPLAVARAIHLLALHLLNVVTVPTAAHTQEIADLLELLSECICSPPRTLVQKYSAYERHQVTRLVDQYVLRRRRHEEEELLRQQQAQQAQQYPSQQELVGFGSPLTPPPSVPRSSTSSIYSSSDLTPPANGSVPQLVTDDSPLTVSSLDLSHTATIESLSTSPPTTPLFPPKRPFTNVR